MPGAIGLLARAVATSLEAIAGGADRRARPGRWRKREDAEMIIDALATRPQR
jgi:hypothetical protein